jgi:AICAR transformylase/IMP cyclohydrolase PurH
LGVRDNAEHAAAMTEHGIDAIDLVVVNLYPFEETVAQVYMQLYTTCAQTCVGSVEQMVH